jgi:hypothetical protein
MSKVRFLKNTIFKDRYYPADEKAEFDDKDSAFLVNGGFAENVDDANSTKTNADTSVSKSVGVSTSSKKTTGKK